MQTLAQQAWLTSPASRMVLSALATAGATPRFVGGCVRDGLLGQPSADLDIAVDQPPEDNMRVLKAAGVKVIPTGLKHGTITAITHGQLFEITTLRVDLKTFGRHADVAFTDDWHRDAARRDFTINAIYADSGGQVFDPVGGRADLAAGRVRFVGDAARRIAEDKLRILRFFRFQARFGGGAPDRRALAACTAAASGINGLSGERVRDETFKILALPNPGPTLEAMARSGVLHHILPHGFDLAGLANCDADPLRRLSAIATNAADTIAERLRLSKQQSRRLKFLMSPPLDFGPDISRSALRQLLYDHGAEAITDLALRQGSPEQVVLIKDADPPRFPLGGRDAIAAGMSPGPEVGELLHALEQQWREDDFRADRYDLLSRLKNQIG
ncbi:MAG: CCA tRNA nucleotidyltransferase [Alphaproteobacteria bacterium]